jgi:hypothetical protein
MADKTTLTFDEVFPRLAEAFGDVGLTISVRSFGPDLANGNPGCVFSREGYRRSGNSQSRVNVTIDGGLFVVSAPDAGALRDALARRLKDTGWEVGP